MKKKKSVYLPNNEKEIFKIVPLKDGIEIPLAYFNRPKYHLTIIAIKDNEKNETRVNYHIKNELTDQKIINKTFFISDILIKEIEIKAIEKFKEVYLKNKQNLEKNKYYSEELYCTTCAGDNFLKINLEKKEGARQMNKFLDEDYENKEAFMSHLLTSPICENTKHNYLYCNKTDSIYIKSHLGIIKKEAYFKFIDDWMESMKEYTRLFQNFINRGIREYDEIFKKK